MVLFSATKDYIFLGSEIMVSVGKYVPVTVNAYSLPFRKCALFVCKYF